MLILLSSTAYGNMAIKHSSGSADFASALYRESFEDMSVKVMGGHVKVKRIWQDTHWIFFPNWKDLSFKYDKGAIQQASVSTTSTDGATTTESVPLFTAGKLIKIKRGVYEYDRVEGGQNGEELFKFSENKIITKHSSGYTWRDRRGNKIEYDENGKILKLLNRNGVEISFSRNSDGKIEEVKDHFGHVVLRVKYENGHVIEVKDYTDRKVTYHWNGNDLDYVTDLRGFDWSYKYTTLLGLRVMSSKSTPADPSDTEFPEGRKTYINHQIIYGGMQCIPTQRNVGDEGVYVVQNSTIYNYNITQLTKTDCVTVSVPDTLMLRSIKDADGQGVTYDYFYDGQQKTYTLIEKWPGGLRNESVIDLNGETKAEWKNNSRVGQTVKDGNKQTYIDEMGLKTIREYDQWKNLIKITYPDQTTESWQFDNFSQVTSHMDANGEITEYKYDDKGNLEHQIEAKGTVYERNIEHNYDQYGNKIETKYVGDSKTLESTRTWTYDNYGNISSIKNGEGKTVRFENYDAMGNPFLIIDPDQFEWHYVYDDSGKQINSYKPLGWQSDPKYGISRSYYNNGMLKQLTNEEGDFKKFTYDIRNRVKTYTDALNNTTKIERNYKGQVLSIEDADGHKTIKNYDSLGRLISKVDWHGNQISYAYNNDGSKPSNSLDYIQYPTFKQEFIYDNRKRVKQILETPNGSDTPLLVNEFTYNALGQKKTVVDAANNKTEYVYDVLGRQERVIDADQNETIYEYDSRNNIVSVTDPRNNKTQYNYDKDNHQIKVIRPMGEEYQYFYDNRGNIDYIIDAVGNKIDYQYNPNMRIDTQTIYNSTDLQNPERIINYDYFDDGKLKSYDDQVTSSVFEYTAMNRLQKETLDFGTFSKSYSYSYHKNGDLKTYTDPENQTVNYTYDNNRRLQLIQIPNVGSYSVNSYQWNRPNQVTFPGGATQNNSFNHKMKPEEILVKDPAQNNKMVYKYSYDNLGNIDTKLTEFGSYDYNFDNLYRLTETINSSSSETFTYDLVGNRMTTHESADIWDYNGNNELESRPNVNYQYNDNGSTIQASELGLNTTYIYNGSNRLSEIKDHSGTTVAKYYYSPFGRRLSKEIVGSKTYYFYSLQGLIGEYTENGTMIRGYGYKPNGKWTTDPLYLKTANIREKHFFYLNDHIGTPQKLISTTGAVVWNAIYDSFGKATLQPIDQGVQLIENPLRFSGQYEDQETGLHQNYFRYYNPKIGRYITKDPIGLSGGINVYAYVSSNPLRYIDTLGLIAGCSEVSCQKKPGTEDILDYSSMTIPDYYKDDPDDPDRFVKYYISYATGKREVRCSIKCKCDSIVTIEDHIVQEHTRYFEPYEKQSLEEIKGELLVKLQEEVQELERWIAQSACNQCFGDDCSCPPKPKTPKPEPMPEPEKPKEIPDLVLPLEWKQETGEYIGPKK